MQVDYNKASIGIIGAGHVGATLGTKWARAGYKVFFSSRHPEKLNDLVATAGVNAKAVTVEQAAKLGDIVLLAVPFGEEPGLSKEIGEWLKGKVVLNCDNAFTWRDGELANQATEAGVAFYSSRHFFPQVKMARAFNSVPMALIETATREHPVPIPVAADDQEPLLAAEELIQAADGVATRSGNLKDSKKYDFHG